MTDGDEVFEFDWGRTVWFSLKGTGGPITVDPGGSHFDTVVAIYVRAGDQLEQVACVDDDPVSGRRKDRRPSIPSLG